MSPKPFAFQLADLLASLPPFAMPPAERAVLFALATHANPDGGDCFPSQTRVRALCGLSVSKIVEVTKALADRHWITRRVEYRNGEVVKTIYVLSLDGIRWTAEERGKSGRALPVRSRVPRMAVDVPSTAGGLPRPGVEGSPALDRGSHAVEIGVPRTAQRIPQENPSVIPQEKPPIRAGGVSIGELAVPPRPLALPGFEALPTPEAAIEDSIFAAYLEARSAHGVKGPSPVLDEKRRRMIRGRFGEGFTAEDLRTAAAGMWRSDWHVREKRTGFELVVRDAAGVERFRDLAIEAARPTPEPWVAPRPTLPSTPEESRQNLIDLAARQPHLRERIEGILANG